METFYEISQERPLSSLRADFGFWGGEKRKKLQSLRNGVSFLVLDHMTAMSYLPKYCVILRERRQRNFIQNCLERYDTISETTEHQG